MVKNLKPLRRRAGKPCRNRNSPIRKSRTSAPNPAPRTAPRKNLSSVERTVGTEIGRGPSGDMTRGKSAVVDTYSRLPALWSLGWMARGVPTLVSRLGCVARTLWVAELYGSDARPGRLTARELFVIAG